MTKKDLIFAAIAISVIGVFIFLSLIGRKPTPVTARAEHAGITRDTPRETCWGCHTPESPVWLRHPKKGKPPDQTTPCSACHKFPDSPAVALIDSAKTSEGVLLWLNRQQE
jgi:hypothetical protein